jgi:AbiV family abortive infection protein
MLNLKKIDWLALLALHNAVRLHGDAIHLYKDQRYSSAFQLSVISQEEIGKAHIASDFVWHSRVDGRYPLNLEKEIIDLLYKHPVKQGAFLRNSDFGFSLLTTKQGRKIYDGVFNGELENQKQNATYVGLTKTNKKPNIKGKVLQPTITRLKAQKQITIVNDYLIHMTSGHIIGSHELDITDVKRVLNRRLMKELLHDWKVISPGIKTWLINAKKFAKENKIRPF